MDTRSQLASIIGKNSRARDLDLRSADFAHADLSNLNADGLNLRAADLCRANLRETRFGDCHFEGAKFEDADWSGATLRMCVLDGAQGPGARFDNARIEDSSVKGADLTLSSLRGAKLTETSFERSILRGAVLDDAEGDGAIFRGADLRGATLIGARLDDADFRGADLREADLSRGRFRDADFRGAILDGVQWTDTDLRGATIDKDAGPVQEPASTTDSASSAPYEKEFESMVRWVEGLLKTAGEGTSEGSQPQPFPNLGEVADSTELRDLLKAFEKTLTSRGLQGEKMLSSLQNILDVLETAPEGEPPEAWKPAIAQILTRLKGAEQEPNPIEILNIFLEALSRPSGPQAAPQSQEDIGVKSEAHWDSEQNGARTGKPEAS